MDNELDELEAALVAAIEADKQFREDNAALLAQAESLRQEALRARVMWARLNTVPFHPEVEQEAAIEEQVQG